MNLLVLSEAGSVWGPCIILPLCTDEGKCFSTVEVKSIKLASWSSVFWDLGICFADKYWPNGLTVSTCKNFLFFINI